MVSAPWGVVSQHALRQTTPPVNRMTDRCKNITLLQTLFAGGNKQNTKNVCILSMSVCVRATTINVRKFYSSVVLDNHHH